MIREDYIKRLIARAGPILARVLGLRKEGKREQAEAVLRQAFGDLLGMDANLVLALPRESLQQLFLMNPQEAAGKARVAADLLQEHAALLADAGSAAEAAMIQEKSETLRRWSETLPGGRP